jgi:hypothetical protein
MVSQEGLSTNMDLFFYETNYSFLSIRMKTYLMDLGFENFPSFVTSYTVPTMPPTYAVRKNPSENIAKAMNSILCGLSESDFVKVMHFGLTN